MVMRLLQRLDNYARQDGGRVAYHEVGPTGRRLSYAQLWQSALAFAGRLRREAGCRSTVMLCLPNRIEFPVAFIGALAAGCSVFPVSTEIAEAELLALASAAKPAAIVGIPRVRHALKDHVPVRIDEAEVLAGGRETSVEPADSDLDMLLCSSGTTARPKIVLRSAASLDAVCAGMCNGVGFGRDDRVLAIVPLCHSYGIEHGLLAPMWAGSTVHLCNGLDLANVVPQLTGGGITLFPGAPSMYEMICQLADAGALPALRKAYAAGAPLPGTVYAAFESKYGKRIGQLYGATEIGSVAFNDPEGAHFDPRSVGAAFEGVQIRIVDPDTRSVVPAGSEGEVLIRASSMFRGYLGESGSCMTDGFYATGDLGRLDSAGNLTITGRIKLLIDVGGRKVNVLEVEELLMQHPSVGAAAVVPVRASETVFRLKAFIAPRNPEQLPVAEELRHFLRQRLSAYKVPRVIEVCPSLPRSPSGKILRRLLEAS